MEQRIRGFIAYFFSWIGGLVVLLAFKDNTRETNFNASQSIVLFVAYFALNILVSILRGIISGIVIATGAKIGFISGILGFVGSIVSIGYVVLAIIGMVKAYKEEEYKLPLISDLTEKIFKSKLA